MSTLTIPSVGEVQDWPAPGPKGYPLVGSLPSMRRDPLKFFLDATLDYGDVISINLGLQRILLVNKPEHIKHVFQDNYENYRKSDMVATLKPIFGNGIIMSEGDTWLEQRRTILPAVRGARFSTMAASITGATSDMLDRWDRQTIGARPLNLSQEMIGLTLDAILRTMFSVTTHKDSALVHDALAVILRHIEKRVWALLPIPESVPTSSNRAFRRALRTLDNLVQDLIDGRRRDPASHDDLLSVLLAAYDDPQTGTKDPKLLRDQVMSMLIAGHETVSNALTWTWYMLSRNPTVENRIREELDTVLSGRVATMADLAKLAYAAKTFKEAMRLYPPVWYVSRTALADDRLGDTHIAAGSTLVVCAYALHRNPRYWENPEGFDPERFNDADEAARHKCAYLPFGGGPRNCLGMRFAMMEGPLIMATVLQRYRLELVPGRNVEPEPMITLRPSEDLLMTARPATTMAQ